jgi:hypothetical protein
MNYSSTPRRTRTHREYDNTYIGDNLGQRPSKADLRNLTVRLESKFALIDSRITDTGTSLKLLIAEKTNRFTMIIVGFGVTQLAAIAGLFLKN